MLYTRMYVYVFIHMFTTRIKIQVHTKDIYFNFDSLCRFSREILPTLKYWSAPNKVCVPLSELTYILAIVIGGLSAELTLKTVKLASTKHYDNLHTSGNEVRHFISCIYLCTVCMYVNSYAVVIFLN